jgi:hypothetical protein
MLDIHETRYMHSSFPNSISYHHPNKSFYYAVDLHSSWAKPKAGFSVELSNSEPRDLVA